MGFSEEIKLFNNMNSEYKTLIYPSEIHLKVLIYALGIHQSLNLYLIHGVKHHQRSMSLAFLT